MLKIVKTEKIVEAKCDLCNKSLYIKSNGKNHLYYERIKISGDMFSPRETGDSFEAENFQVCDKCYHKHIEKLHNLLLRGYEEKQKEMYRSIEESFQRSKQEKPNGRKDKRK